jgi:hypothetical protein
MEWIRKRVWQLGLASLLVLIGSILIYLFGMDEGEQSAMWVGLILVFIGLLIPLAVKLYNVTQEESGEEGEN